jgi:hypothetical protein
LKDYNGRPEGGSECESIKILLEEDVFSNKINTAKSQNHFQHNLLKFAKTT